VRVRVRRGPNADTWGGNVDMRLARDPNLALFKRDLPALLALHTERLAVRNLAVEWADDVPTYFTHAIEAESFRELPAAVRVGSAGRRPARSIEHALPYVRTNRRFRLRDRLRGLGDRRQLGRAEGGGLRRRPPPGARPRRDLHRHAAGYGDGRSERIIGKVLKERKETVFVATKAPPSPGPWPPTPYCRDDERYSESYLRTNVEERLRNLGTERIGLLQLHTWTRAWNRNPRPFEILRTLQAEGKIRFIGFSTPEHDQNSVIDLMRGGWLDAEANCGVSDLAPMPEELVLRLRQHAWLRAFWYGGK
jgi:hypothetical protein